VTSDGNTRSRGTISSSTQYSRSEEIKLQRFKEKIEAIKKNEDEYLGLQIIDDALMDFKVYEKDINDYYHLQKDLGWGKFGVVKKAVSISSPDYEVAVKIINLRFIKGKYHYLAQEVMSLKRVDHPNIIKLLEVYKNEDKIYIVMELVKGVDLLDFLFSNEKMTEFQASTIIRQLLKALMHLNSLRMCHRDIKLENIMIDPATLHIKLIDFGFSSFIMDKDLLYTQVGTPYYISPQILKGEYGKEWDMWSIGIVWFILLTGFPPFKSNNLKEIYRTIVQNNIEFLPKLWRNKSNFAYSFTRQWLQYNPSERLTPEEALQHPWIVNEKEGSTIDEYLYSKLQKLTLFTWEVTFFINEILLII